MKSQALFFWSPLVALALAGCGARSGQTSALQTDVRGLAASFVAGRAFDLAQSALKSDNNAALRVAGRRYADAITRIDDRGVLLSAVAPIIAAGTRWDSEAKFAALSRREALAQRALDKYRAASAFLPANPQPGSVDANTLNMVGYSLADRGTTRADWQRAAQLTRLSLAEWDRQIEPLPAKSPERAQLEAARTLGALDSYAWSLFKLGRIAEAVQKQEQVMFFAYSNPAALSAELPFHLAEIYRAAGRDDEARQQYQVALSLAPDPEMLSKIDSALNGTFV